MSTTSMYSVKPVFSLTNEFTHTSSMYKLKALKNGCTIQESQLKHSSNDLQSEEVNILSRQEKLLNNLKVLQQQLKSVRDKINVQESSEKIFESIDTYDAFKNAGIQDVVINADPQHPPYAILWLFKLWNLPINISIHVHSSISKLPEKLTVFNSLTRNNLDKYSFKVTFIWKEVGPDTQFIVSPIKNKPILGEVNILRFFEAFCSNNETLATKIKNNEILDITHRLNHVTGKEVYALIAKLSNLLGTNNSFSSNRNPCIVDVAVWSVLCRKTQLNALPSNIKKWALLQSNSLGEYTKMRDNNFRLLSLYVSRIYYIGKLP